MKTDPPRDELWLNDPALGSLLAALTSGPTTDELASQHAVLAAFRDARDARDARIAALPIRPGRRGRRVAGLAVAAVAVLLAGFVAAGYAAVFPPSLQRVANGVFRSLHLREADQHAQPPARGQVSLGAGGIQSSDLNPGSTRSGRGRIKQGSLPPASGATGRSAVPLRPTGLTAWVPTGPRTAAGSSVMINAYLADNGKGVRDAPLRLLEHIAGKPGWRLVSKTRTRPGGGATLVAAHLTVNAWFRVTGPGPRASTQFPIVVVPRIWLRLRKGPHHRHAVLLVRCQYAASRDVVALQVWSSPGRWSGAGPQAWGEPFGRHGNGQPSGWLRGSWRTVRLGRIGKAGYASFRVSTDAVGQVYRVMLQATATHGESVSDPVLVEPHVLHWTR